MQLKLTEALTETPRTYWEKLIKLITKEKFGPNDLTSLFTLAEKAKNLNVINHTTTSGDNKGKTAMQIACEKGLGRAAGLLMVFGGQIFLSQQDQIAFIGKINALSITASEIQSIFTCVNKCLQEPLPDASSCLLTTTNCASDTTSSLGSIKITLPTPASAPPGVTPSVTPKTSAPQTPHSVGTRPRSLSLSTNSLKNEVSSPAFIYAHMFSKAQAELRKDTLPIPPARDGMGSHPYSLCADTTNELALKLAKAIDKPNTPENNKEIMALLDEGALHSDYFMGGWTPLMHAVSNNKNRPINNSCPTQLQLLLEHGRKNKISLNRKIGKTLLTVLDLAVRSRDYFATEQILNADQVKDKRQISQDTDLIELVKTAIYMKDFRIALRLLQAMKNPDTPDTSGQKVTDYEVDEPYFFENLTIIREVALEKRVAESAARQAAARAQHPIKHNRRHSISSSNNRAPTLVIQSAGGTNRTFFLPPPQSRAPAPPLRSPLYADNSSTSAAAAAAAATTRSGFSPRSRGPG